MSNECEELILADKKNYVEYANYTLYPYPRDRTIWKLPDFEQAIKLLAYIVIIVGGLFGNVTVILTIALNRSMRNTINFYIANLAVADAMMCAFCMVPRFFLELAGGAYIFGAFMCKFLNFIQVALLTSSVLTLSAISCDRFMAVMFPFYVRITKQRPYVLTTIIWILSLAVAIPHYIVKMLVVVEWKDFKQKFCVEKWPNQPYYDETLQKCVTYRPLLVIYYTVVSVTLFFLPILIMIVAYSCILWRLWMAKIPGEQQAANINARSKAKKQVIKMISVVLAVFIICWVPLQVIILYLAFKGGSTKPPKWFKQFHWFSYYIAHANSFMNPIVYGGFNKSFRDGIWSVLRCGFLRGKSGNTARSKVFTIRRNVSSSQDTLETQISACESSSQKSSNMEMELKHQVAEVNISSNTNGT